MKMPLATIFFMLLSFSCLTNAHNVTQILEGKPEFSTLNTLLIQSGLAEQINSMTTVTLLAAPNSILDPAIQQLGSQVTPQGVFYVLSFHIVLGFYDLAKLRLIPFGTERIATLYQTTGRATGLEGYINVTNVGAGEIRTGPLTTSTNGFLPIGITEDVYAAPYTMSILKIDGIITLPGLLDSPPSVMNLTNTIAQNGNYSTFLSLARQLGVLPVLESRTTAPGETVFLPTDAAFAALPPGKLDALTIDQKTRLLQYHVTPLFYSRETLTSLNGKYVKTLASVGSTGGYTFTIGGTIGSFVIRTGVNSANIGESLYSVNPVSLFGIDAVLMPPELAATPAPESAPSSVPSHAPSSSPTPTSKSAPGSRASASAPSSKSTPTSNPSPKVKAISVLLQSPSSKSSPTPSPGSSSTPSPTGGSNSLSMSAMGGLALFALAAHLL